jgi:hypothetical protein
MNTEELNELAIEIHELAKEKGWWDQERTRGEIYALIHSEISEAVEEARNNLPEIYYEGHKDHPERLIKPYGELIELADVVIRCLDWMVHEGIKFTYVDPRNDVVRSYPYELTKLEFYNLLHEQLAYLSNSQMNEFILTIELFCYLNKWDLWGAVRIKHEYNKTRPHRHGGKMY